MKKAIAKLIHQRFGYVTHEITREVKSSNTTIFFVVIHTKTKLGMKTDQVTILAEETPRLISLQLYVFDTQVTSPK